MFKSLRKLFAWTPDQGDLSKYDALFSVWEVALILAALLATLLVADAVNHTAYVVLAVIEIVAAISFLLWFLKLVRSWIDKFYASDSQRS